MVTPWSDERSANLALGGTVRDRVVAVLRDRILSGQLPRGTRIDLDQLAEEFGTSRTPVREAVLGLAQEGLTHVAPRSRATVVGLTPRDVLDNFTVMSVLSGLAGELAATRATDDELSDILELGRALDEAEGPELVRVNWAFHRAINRASHSSPLLTQLGMCSKLVPQSFFAVIPEQASNSRTDHAELVESLAARDAARVRVVMERHFRSAGELLSAQHTEDSETPTDASA
jgi:DNA-binding GntR family transcriptional regulator